MITILNGSTPRRHQPRSVASSAVIAQVGIFAPGSSQWHPATDGAAHPRPHADPRHHARPASTPRRRRPPCQRSRPRAIDSGAAPSCRRHHAGRVVGGRLQGLVQSMKAAGLWRGSPVADDHSRIPADHPFSIGWRHQTHAADRQIRGHPSP
jgi:hypothetical protein